MGLQCLHVMGWMVQIYQWVRSFCMQWFGWFKYISESIVCVCVCLCVCARVCDGLDGTNISVGLQCLNAMIWMVQIYQWAYSVCVCVCVMVWMVQNATSSTTNSTWTGLGANPGIHDESLATNCLALEFQFYTNVGYSVLSFFGTRCLSRKY
jgi:hypothetical protein